MDSNNTQNKELEINLKEAFKFILFKAWIVILVAIFSVIISFVYTNLTFKPVYSSSAKLFITSESEIVNGNTNLTSPTTDWNLSRQYALSSPEFVTIDFCQVVANRLNNENLDADTAPYSCSNFLGSDKSFSEFYKEISGGLDKITAESIYNSINLSSNSSSCTMTVTSYSDNPILAAIISNCIADSFEDYLVNVLETDQVNAKVLNSAKVAKEPYNVKTTRNLVLGAFIGIFLSCGVLFLIFILDDKIKSPEDVEKYLGISVLGSIPELEKEI